jgi:glycosyltransferase involved in cell wall biosynthesis
MPEPKISIILGTFNRAHFILASLESVSKQTFKNWECLIIDDGSSDNTKQIVSSYIKDDKRFNYLERPDSYKKGLPGARNYGLDMAEGDFIIFYDDDDVSHPQNIEICLKSLLDSGTDFCHYKKKSFTTYAPNYEYLKFPIAQYEIGLNQIEQVVSNKLALASCTVMWRKECFTNIRFNEYLTYAEEWECYTRILLEGYKGVGIDEVLYFNRKHPASNTGEFWAGDTSRKASQVKAMKLVIDKLKHKKLLSRSLIRYFVQMGIFLKERSVLDYVLQISKASFSVRTKFRMLYTVYPVFVIGHRTKNLIKKKLS